MNQRLDYEYMICVGLHDAMEHFAENAKMGKFEAKQWKRGTTHGQELGAGRTDFQEILYRTLEWMKYAVEKEIKLQDEESRRLSEKCIDCGKKNCRDVCWGAGYSSDGELPNTCDYCGKDGHREDMCWDLRPELAPSWARPCRHCGWIEKKLARRNTVG